MSMMRFIMPLTLVATLWLTAIANSAPDDKTGVTVGEKAPAFTLKDQAGNERTLDEFLKKGKVALVFYRSAGW
jgi:cytochrome oxidase Cu insertion factor (SCO1/SenC/PrrC family)